MLRNKEEKPSVKLKGVGENIWVSVDPSRPLDILRDDLRLAFERLNRVAFNARIILDPGDQEDHKDLIEPLAAFLKENFGVGAVSGPSRRPVQSEERARHRDVVQAWRNCRSEALILSGRVRSGQNVTAKKHLVLLGDVNPGGEVVAGGDILIMGSFCGTAAAGQPDHEEAIILALDFRPIQVQISGVITTSPSHTSDTARAEFARVENGVIKIEDYAKASPFGRLSWPQVR